MELMISRYSSESIETSPETLFHGSSSGSMQVVSLMLVTSCEREEELRIDRKLFWVDSSGVM